MLKVNGKVIPTDKPYRVIINGKWVNLTVVKANNKIVWKYVKPVTPPGGGGHWVAAGPGFSTELPGINGSASGAYPGAVNHCSLDANGHTWHCIPMKWVPADEPSSLGEIEDKAKKD